MITQRRYWLCICALAAQFVLQSALPTSANTQSKSQPSLVTAEGSGIVPSQSGHLLKAQLEIEGDYTLADVQRILRDEGLYAGAIDSIWGPGTQRGLLELADRAHAALDGGEFATAEELFRIVSAGFDRGVGPTHPETLLSLQNLALAIESQGRYTEAEGVYLEVALKADEALGPRHPQSLRSKWNLAVSIGAQGRYAEAETILRPVVEIATEILGSEDTATLGMLNSLAGLALDQGRHSEAEASLVRLVDGLDRLVGPEHPFTLTTLNNLGLSIAAQGRHSEAEELFRKAADGRSKVLGSDHPATLTSMHTLANSIASQERHAEAEELLREITQMRERVLGVEHPQAIDSSNSLAISIMMQGRDAEAEEILRKVVERREKILSASHPDAIGARNNLATTLLKQNRYPEAEALLRDALGTQIAVLGEEHPRTLAIRENLATALSKQGKISEAIVIREEGISQLTGYFALASSSAVYDQRKTLPLDLNAYLDDLAIANLADKDSRSLIAQGWLTFGELDFTIGDLVARTAVGTSPADAALRDYQEARETARRARDAYVLGFKKVSLGEAGRETLDENWRLAERDLAEKRNRLVDEFPSISSASLPLPLDAKEARTLLQPGEAMIAYAVTNHRLHAWLITPQGVNWVQQDFSAEELNGMVGEVRSVLDIPAETMQRYSSLDEMLLDHAFPIDAARELHAKLLGMLDLSGFHHLIVVPDGSLETLPFAALVSGSNADGTPRWLIEDYSVSVLPTTSSLRLLRGADRNQTVFNDQLPFLGIAPVEFVLGPGSPLRQRLSDLPGTRNEITRLSEILSAGPDATILGSAATEHFVKTVALDQFAIVSFATHGLLSSETAQVTNGVIEEPALILGAGEGEDGILTASEILGLRMRADWVLLSACNTSAGDSVDAEGLSGLARAFFFAGSDALLVSHWAVSDVSAEALMTNAIDAYSSSPSGSKPQALRSAMLKMIAQPETAHPFHWAAFDTVGD